MTHRWIIRCTFMLPILLCAAAWLWTNAVYMISVSCAYRARGIACWTYPGVLCIKWEDFSRSHYGSAYHNGLHYHVTREWQSFPFKVRRPSLWPPWPVPQAPYMSTTFSCLGLGYDLSDKRLYIPFWLLILAFAALLFFVWRRTAPPKPGRGFPVEVTGVHASACHEEGEEAR